MSTVSAGSHFVGTLGKIHIAEVRVNNIVRLTGAGLRPLLIEMEDKEGNILISFSQNTPMVKGQSYEVAGRVCDHNIRFSVEQTVLQEMVSRKL